MPQPNRSWGSRWVLALVCMATVAVLGLAACEDNEGSGAERLFAPQGNQLDVYDTETDVATVFIPSEQNNVNGEVCPLPDGSGKFLMGEDTNQDTGVRMGWGIFSPEGELLQKIPEPETPGEAKQPEPYGCAFDDQDRLFVSDIGSGQFGADDGKLIVFFPPEYETFCVLDTTIRTAGALAIDDEANVYLAESVPPGEVLRFAPPFPASAEECDSVDVNRATFIKDKDLNTPLGIVRQPNGNWYMSSVLLPPVIREYDAEGTYIRTILDEEAGGNPAGLALASDGTLYYADLALEEKPPPQAYGPAEGEGTVRKITFDADGEPAPPETIGQGLDYPDSVSVLPGD